MGTGRMTNNCPNSHERVAILRAGSLVLLPTPELRRGPFTKPVPLHPNHPENPPKVILRETEAEVGMLNTRNILRTTYAHLYPTTLYCYPANTQC
jgi:hypothetical protein